MVDDKEDRDNDIGHNHMLTKDNDEHDTSSTEFNSDDNDKTDDNGEDAAVLDHNNPSYDDMKTSTPGGNQHASNRNNVRPLDGDIENSPTADAIEYPDENDYEVSCHEDNDDQADNSNT